jgi:RimJ/RimL family protein N-acetyltransferase
MVREAEATGEIPFSFLESPRLILRNFQESDLSAFLAYRNDPEVARYQSWDSVSALEARAFIQEQQTALPGAPGQWFQFALELKETGALVGDCGLRIEAHDPRLGEIGFTLARRYQRQGFASEAISRLFHYTFGTLGLHRIIAIVDCRNARSITLLERIRMRREGHFIQNSWFKGDWTDEYLYAILASEWLSRHNESA